MKSYSKKLVEQSELSKFAFFVALSHIKDEIDLRKTTLFRVKIKLEKC